MFGQGQLLFLIGGVLIGLALCPDGRTFMVASVGKIGGLFGRKGSGA